MRGLSLAVSVAALLLLFPALLPLLGWLNGIALALLGAGLGVA
jgi:hypothetical protein